MAGNMQWTHVMKNVEIQWKNLKNHKDDDDLDVPKISKALPIIKWTKWFQGFLYRVIGVWTIVMVYVIHPSQDVTTARPALATSQPHWRSTGQWKASSLLMHLTPTLFTDYS